MKRLLFTSLCFFLFSLSLIAQKEETVFGYSGLRLTGVWGGPSIGTSKYGENYTFHQGGFLGFEFNNSLFVGWGWYKIEDVVQFQDLPILDFDMRYNGFMLGYSAFPNKMVHPKFSLLTGGGTFNIESEGKDRVFILQPSAGFEMNLFRWSHASVEAGYRIAANSDYLLLSDSDLSSWFVEFKFLFGFSWGW
jgi:hypothetical protein